MVAKATGVCYGLNVCVPPDSDIEILIPNADGIWGWGLWETLKS